MCSVSKILEEVVLHRMLPALEPTLGLRQFAYRQERGTEFHLLELYDFATKAEREGKQVYIASLDIAGAFDTVPHEKLSEALRRKGVEEHLYRYLWNWITKRRFKVRLASPQGNRYSSYCEITRGLPQGI